VGGPGTGGEARHQGRGPGTVVGGAENHFDEVRDALEAHDAENPGD
jgi:hypothetical protein